MLQQKDIRKVLLAGAGVMGSSFAQIFAKHGYEVILYDIAERSLERRGASFPSIKRQRWRAVN